MSFPKRFGAALIIAGVIAAAVVTREQPTHGHTAAQGPLTQGPDSSVKVAPPPGSTSSTGDPTTTDRSGIRSKRVDGCTGLDAGLAAVRPGDTGVQTAASINPTSRTDFAGCAFRASVLNLKAQGANEVTLVVPYEQASYTTSVIAPGGDTPTRAALISGIEFVRSVHMRVMVSFHDDMADGQWRAFIDASDRATWFARYGAILDYLGQVGQRNGVAEICLGTEMYDMTSTNANPANGPAWLQMIADLKKVYTGELTYAGQRPGAYENETTSLSFWPEMSQIGIDAYYPLGTTCDPSVASMESEWAQIDSQYFEPLVARYHKPLLFTELGFSSVNCDNLNPAYYGHGGYYPGNGTYDGTGQADLFQALFASFAHDKSWAGISVWFWYSDPTASAPGDLSFSTYRKPAAAVIHHWFHLLDRR